MHASICTHVPQSSQKIELVGIGRPASYVPAFFDPGEIREMRSGGCAVQQELAADAAAVMRQAVSLARRRGHAQVTPLHVASAMLADAGGLLRAACLRSRATSHPLQCKALELCFNVALNRLATAGAGAPAPAMLLQQFHAHHAGQQRAPTLSNALAAAFKRAQANQRRGGGGSASAEVAARVELEQLVISILDDPGVSRVMREAGFSSAEVKANVEKAVVSSSPENQSSSTASSTTSAASPNAKPPRDSNKAKADAARVLDCMASGRSRRVVVVGESAATAEGVVKALMDKVSKGDLRHQHECLKNAQLVPFSAASFQRLPREQVDARAGDLRALIREARAAGKGVVLVLEDLAYAAEAWAAASWNRNANGRCYCPVEHAVMELSSLLRGGGGRGHDMFWLLGFAAYASYTSCRLGQPSLEAVLELHPILVPDGSLALSLAGDSEITHCGGADMAVATAASVPSWIRRFQQQGPVPTGSELTLSFSSPASSSLSGFAHHDANMIFEPRHDLIDRRRQPLPNHGHHGPTMAGSCDQQLIANPNPGSSNSVSKSNSASGRATEPAARRPPKFTELTAENLKIMCGALEARVPRHGDIAPGIASAVLQRRSGVTRTARPTSSATWLLFQGRDTDGKTAMARELARLVFGSYAEFTCITAPELTLAPSGSNSGDSLKRQRSPDDDHGCMQRFYEAIRENPHRVVMIIDGVEHDLEAGIKNAMATGIVRGCDGDEVSLEDAIVVMSCEVFESRSRVSSPRLVKQQRVMSDGGSKQVEGDDTEKGAAPRFGLDLNACATAAAMDGDGEEEGISLPNDIEILKAVDGVFFFQN